MNENFEMTTNESSLEFQFISEVREIYDYRFSKIIQNGGSCFNNKIDI